MSKLPLQVIWLPRPSAKYAGCYPLGFEQMLPELLGTKDYAHLFAGMAKTGFRIDIKAELKPDLVADVHKLPLPDEKFEAAMADPPYVKDKKGDFAKELYGLEMPKWSIWTSEMVRIVKRGGLIGIMENYVVPRLKGCQYVKILVILTRIKQYPKIVTIQRKDGGGIPPKDKSLGILPTIL